MGARGNVRRALGVGERVYVRRPRPADEDEYLALLRASAGLHARWFPRLAPGEDPYGSDRFRRLLARSRSPRHEPLLACRVEGGAIVAQLSLSEIVRGAFWSAYLGYWVGEPHARRGYVREALPLVIDHAFGALELHRVEANVQPENAPSVAVVRGAGFRHEGRSLRYLRIDGAWRDHDRYALLAEEWREARAART